VRMGMRHRFWSGSELLRRRERSRHPGVPQQARRPVAETGLRIGTAG
jgi:hypothetical protein